MSSARAAKNSPSTSQTVPASTTLSRSSLSDQVLARSDEPYHLQLTRRQCRRIRICRTPAVSVQLGNVLGDALGVPPDARKHVGRDRVLEDQAHEAQAGLGFDD